MTPGFLLHVQIQLKGLEEKTFPCWQLTHFQRLTLRRPSMHAKVWDGETGPANISLLPVLCWHTASAEPPRPGDPVSDWPGFNFLHSSHRPCFVFLSMPGMQCRTWTHVLNTCSQDGFHFLLHVWLKFGTSVEIIKSFLMVLWQIRFKKCHFWECQGLRFNPMTEHRGERETKLGQINSHH